MYIVTELVHARWEGCSDWAERHQPECRLDAGRLLALLRPDRHQRVLGAWRLLLITPRVAQEGGHFPHRRRLRARVVRWPCLPASRLLAADLADNTTAPPAGPTLHARTEPAAMGEVTAFLSHSWSDEKEAPGAKHALVALWAEQRQETTGKETTLWLVALRPIAAPCGSHRMHVR